MQQMACLFCFIDINKPGTTRFCLLFYTSCTKNRNFSEMSPFNIQEN